MAERRNEMIEAREKKQLTRRGFRSGRDASGMARSVVEVRPEAARIVSGGTLGSLRPIRNIREAWNEREKAESTFHCSPLELVQSIIQVFREL